MDQKKIGAFLKELRRDKGLTQEQLAESLNVSGRTVSRWETGSNMPDLDILISLSNYYEVDIKELLDGERRSEKMDKEQSEMILKVVDYSNYKGKTLIQKIYGLIVTGIIAWGISFAVMLRFMNDVTGTQVLLLFEFSGLLLYSICMLVAKANRTTNGYVTSLIGLFAAIISSNLILFLLFFSTGSYYNYGIVSVYYSLIIIVMAFLISGIVTTIINRKENRKNKK